MGEVKGPSKELREWTEFLFWSALGTAAVSLIGALTAAVILEMLSRFVS